MQERRALVAFELGVRVADTTVRVPAFASIAAVRRAVVAAAAVPRVRVVDEVWVRAGDEVWRNDLRLLDGLDGLLHDLSLLLLSLLLLFLLHLDFLLLDDHLLLDLLDGAELARPQVDILDELLLVDDALDDARVLAEVRLGSVDACRIN
jgi:hypothetical protein